MTYAVKGLRLIVEQMLRGDREAMEESMAEETTRDEVREDRRRRLAEAAEQMLDPAVRDAARKEGGRGPDLNQEES